MFYTITSILLYVRDGMEGWGGCKYQVVYYANWENGRRGGEVERDKKNRG
jgi:hypothetical protein